MLPKRPAGIRGAPRREQLVDGLAGGLGGADRGRAQPVGVERPGQQVVDGDVVPRDLPGEAGDEAGEARARAVGQAQDVDRRLDRRPT